MAWSSMKCSSFSWQGPKLAIVILALDFWDTVLCQIEPPVYQRHKTSLRHQIFIRPEVLTIRPFVLGAILVGVQLDADSYASFIDLQDKLHQNICRKRSLVAIGTHDLDTVQGPFYYGAEKPREIRFRPLNQVKEYTAEELMILYSTDNHLKRYLPIIAGEERYPVIRDSNGVVLSMPPIINGEHSKIHLGTRNILIEVTATDLEKATIVLNTLVAMFSQYTTASAESDNASFLVEPVEIVSVDGSRQEYPDLRERSMTVSAANIKQRIGVDLKADEICELLNRMSLRANLKQGDKTRDAVEVQIPITRADILHECDVAEDVAIAYGFNRIEQQFPKANTIGEPFALNKLTDLLRYDIAAAGWTETLNFALCSRDDISVKLKKPDNLKKAVKISNPKTLEFQVARTTLLPGLLKTLASNRDMPLPLRLFEIQDVVLKDSTSDPTFLDGRCARIVGPGDTTLGTIGVLHPDVITAFALTLPISVIDLNIEPFL
ncbi:unnamed protein product [Gongylonema pulchrum]|uniref:phenylalanine--tRNA ligase n=1 Tax=Gongylonema pulchrum TaxID=637853 RepID=A0A183E742_9BILA|nr:unnamed protein product [Gongylonema pulchrum]